MATTFIDSRIGGTVNFFIRSGETWQEAPTLLDANNNPIPVAGFTIGPLEIFDRSGNVLFTVAPNEFTVVSTAVFKFAKNIPDDFKKSLGGLNFRCPFLPPGGMPRAIVKGKVKVD
jgi:hypothetical protein